MGGMGMLAAAGPAGAAGEKRTGFYVLETYYLQQGATVTSATIGGNVIMPEITVTLHYFFMRNGEADHNY